MTAEDRAQRTVDADALCAKAYESAGGGDVGCALIAVGGYGRAELAPHSDLDVVLVHDEDVDPGEVASQVWYPLWDSGQTIDHSVRRLDEMVAAADAVPHWAERLEPPGLLHSGGPVSEGSVVGLGLAPDSGDDAVTPLVGRLGVLDLHRDPSDLPGVGSVRLFSGYSGWSAGQLEVEMALGSWFVLDAEPMDALAAV